MIVNRSTTIVRCGFAHPLHFPPAHPPFPLSFSIRHRDSVKSRSMLLYYIRSAEAHASAVPRGDASGRETCLPRSLLHGAPLQR